MKRITVTKRKIKFLLTVEKNSYYRTVFLLILSKKKKRTKKIIVKLKRITSQHIILNLASLHISCTTLVKSRSLTISNYEKLRNTSISAVEYLTKILYI